MSRIRSWFTGRPVTEAATPAAGIEGANTTPRRGYEYGAAALAATNSSQALAESQERLQILTQLHQAYLTCPWVSAPVDLIARTVTAGGLQIEYQTEQAGKKVPAEPPPVQRLRRLMRWVNPREDMVQLLRQTIIDLKLFGDAYIEVVRIAGEPVALYTLDATTMSVICDQHGEVTGYVQSIDGIRKVEFEPDEVIHISLDAPRGGIYGVSPAQKALLPVTAWLFTEATIKENFRQGDPPRLHVDLGAAQDGEVQKWREQYKVFNLGPKAVGTPVITTKKGEVNVLDPRKVLDYLAASKQLRDEIIACFGVPPAKLGIIESGNLGGGTGEAQDKTFRVDTVIPVKALVLEKLNYHIVMLGFGIMDWAWEFGEIDYRDSKLVEEIRDMRLRNGSMTRNQYADEIGNPPVDGGDVAVLVDRQNIVLWNDMAAMSKAMIAGKAKGSNLELDPEADAEDAAEFQKAEKPAPPPMVAVPPADDDAGPDPSLPPDDRPGGKNDATQGEPPKESVYGRDVRKLGESWQRTYRARRRQALKELPPVEVSR
ncbi:phage portal protein [Amycolatopsis sp. CFH S0078]|uniref:phage portal protein n=1 Tax=Amycolatopsis sp. CFH S0078 TaxID=1644108 RepID=UPI00143072B3|nr:phage portal protein [Amycolatopsis sp. CFH S0078]